MFSYKNKYNSPPPPSYTSNIDSYSVDSYSVDSYSVDSYSVNSEYNIKSPKYHGPVVNTENNILKVTTEKYDTRTGNKFKKVGYIDKNSLNNCVNKFTYPRKEVYVAGLQPIPNYLICNNKLTQDEFFREQKRILLNKQLDERLRLEAQRVYPSICYNN